MTKKANKRRKFSKEKKLTLDEIEKIDIDKLKRICREKKNKIKKKQLKGKIHLKKLILKKQEKEIKKSLKEYNLPVPKKEQRTIEKLAIFDNNINFLNEKYVNEENLIDEFSKYFKKKQQTNILITSIKRPSKHTILFIKELSFTFPNIFYEPRLKHSIEYLIQNAIQNKFTTFILIEELQRRPKFFYISTLPSGPTTKFLINNIFFASKIKHQIEITDTCPEIYVHNFNTFIGNRIKRQLNTLVPYNPEYRGQKIVVFYNQRDFIFFRHYKYNFESVKECNLTEIGPGFTLQLLNIKSGLINDKEKMYEFILRPDLKVDRKRMYL